MKERPIIAVTGSAGKSTTKEMIASILKNKWTIYKSKANLNHYSSTQKHIQNIKQWHQGVVLEFGMGSKGSIAKHCKIIKPTIGVVTNVGSAHAGYFRGKVRGIAKEKSNLIKGMKQDGLLFLNADDPNSRLLDLTGFKGKVVKIGCRKKADYFASNIQYADKGMTFDVNINGKKYSFFIPVFGSHHVLNALFAIAVTHQLGCNTEEIKKGLKNTLKMKRRLKLLHLKNKVKVIDDTYSSNPQAAIAAIRVLQNISSQKRIAILGSMFSLGSYSVHGHKKVGKYIAKKKIDLLYTLGAQGKLIGEGAISAGFPKENVKHFDTKERLHEELKKTLEPNSTILIKGSNKMKMHRTVRFLRRML